MKRIKITEGIHLSIIPSNKFKTNLLKINFTLPLDEKTAPLAALLPAVMRRGCERYPTMLDFNRALEYLYATGLGGGTSKIGENQAITFNASFLKNRLISDGTDLVSRVLELVKDFLIKPLFVNGSFCEEYVESEKKNLCDRIEAEINNKGSYAVKRLFDEMCKNEPYSVSPLGTVESVQTVTAKALTEFYKDLIANAPIEIFFVGDCDRKALIEKLTKMLSPLARGKAKYTRSKVIEKASEVKRVVEEMPVNQGKLTMGFRTGASTQKKNTASFMVFNEIFGGSPTSKLFENVREKLSLCYYCSSRFIAPKGIMYITSGVKVGDEGKAEDEIMRQLQDVKAGNFSECDIEEAKMSIINGYTGLYDDADKLASVYLTRIITMAGSLNIEKFIQGIKAVTKEEIMQMASTVMLDTVYFLKGTNLDGGEEAEEE